MQYLENISNANDPHSLEGLSYAREAVEFAALGVIAGQFAALGSITGRDDCVMPQLHLYALAIELAFKSLAIRAGATLKDCKDAGHNIAKMIALIKHHGVTVPMDLRRRLSDEGWFQKFFEFTRYPALNRSRSLDPTLFIHNPGRSPNRGSVRLRLERSLFYHGHYSEMIAAILEIQCPLRLRFKGGSALAEITNMAGMICYTYPKPKDCPVKG